MADVMIHCARCGGTLRDRDGRIPEHGDPASRCETSGKRVSKSTVKYWDLVRDQFKRPPSATTPARELAILKRFVRTASDAGVAHEGRHRCKPDVDGCPTARALLKAYQAAKDASDAFVLAILFEGIRATIISEGSHADSEA